MAGAATLFTIEKWIKRTFIFGVNSKALPVSSSYQDDWVKSARFFRFFLVKMSSRGLPPRWKNCPRVGDLIAGKKAFLGIFIFITLTFCFTLSDIFIPFKVPLSDSFHNLLNPSEYFTPQMMISSMKSKKVSLHRYNCFLLIWKCISSTILDYGLIWQTPIGIMSCRIQRVMALNMSS